MMISMVMAKSRAPLGAGVVIALLLSACASRTDTPEPAVTEPAAQVTALEPIDCGPPITGVEPLLQAGRVIMLGELHGTHEAPAFVVRLACYGAQAGLEVRLGLELPAAEGAALADYLASAGSPEDRARLLAGKHWQGEMQDGRASEAMLALIERARELVAAGAPLDLFVFDYESMDWNERDAAMAATIIAQAEAHPRALIVTLSGNLHVRTVPGLRWDPNAVPMGVHVSAARPEALALDIRHPGGEIWACALREGGGQSCGPMSMKGYDPSGETEIELWRERNEAGLDGGYWLPALTPAPPAVQSSN